LKTAVIIVEMIHFTAILNWGGAGVWFHQNYD